MRSTLKEAISDFFAGRSWKSKTAPGMVAGKRPERFSGAKGLDGSTIRLIKASRSPATTVERLSVEILKREGRTSLMKLVERVAREIYSDEVRSGAWALDIGLYGPNLFVSDVISELKSGNGILWQIEEPEGPRDGILPDLP